MDDTIITIIAAAAIVLFQVVTSINKKKRAREQQTARPQPEYYADFEMDEVEEMEKMDEVEGMEEVKEVVNRVEEVKNPMVVVPRSRIFKPEEEGGPMAKPQAILLEETAVEEEESLLHDFTPQKAILFSEVINPKWNS